MTTTAYVRVKPDSVRDEYFVTGTMFTKTAWKSQTVDAATLLRLQTDALLEVSLTAPSGGIGDGGAILGYKMSPWVLVDSITNRAKAFMYGVRDVLADLGVVFSRIDIISGLLRLSSKNINADLAAGRRSVLLESVTFGALPSGWSNNAWTFDGTKAISGGNGPVYALKTGGSYGLQNRVMRWGFALSSENSKIIFATTSTEGKAIGSYIRVNGGGSPSIDIMNAYNGSSSPSSLVNYAGAPYFLEASPIIYTNGNVKYVAEWIKDGRGFTFNLYAKGGRLIASVSRRIPNVGYVSYPNWSDDQGAMHGSPFVAIDSGSGYVYSFNHYALGAYNPQLYILSDSIGEGFTVEDHQRLGDLIGAQIGHDQVQVSAIGGANATLAINRVMSELPALMPKYMLFCLGTNADATFAASVNTIVDFAQSLGVQVVVCTVPAGFTNTNILTALGLPVVDWASVMTASGPGTTRLTQYYSGFDAAGATAYDTLHPNNVGQQAQFDKLRLDAPFLLDVPKGRAGAKVLTVPTVSQATLGDYVATSSDDTIPVDASLGARVVSLPLAAACKGKELRIGKVDSSANAVSPTCVGSDKINGASTSVAISTQWQFWTLKSNGIGWLVVAKS